MEIKIPFGSSSRIRILTGGGRELEIKPTDALGILTWECPSPGLYHFIHMSNGLLSIMGKTIIFPLPPEEFKHTDIEGWIIGDWDLSTEYPRILPFGLCLGDAMLEEDEGFMLTESGNILYTVDDSHLYYWEDNEDTNNNNSNNN